MAAGDTYRYNVVIGVEVATGQVARGTRDIEQNMSRWEKKVAESVTRIQKQLDGLGPSFDKATQAAARAASRVKAPQQNNRQVQDFNRINKQIEKDLADSNKRRENSHERTNRIIEQSQRTLARAMKNINKDADKDLDRQLKQAESRHKTSADRTKGIWKAAFSGGLIGSFLGNIANKILDQFLSIPGRLKAAFDAALNFRNAQLAIAQFSGSMDVANAKIKELMQVAQSTPGLGFLSAIEGQKRLQAVGFSGEQATKILVGMSKVRVLSGSTKEDFDAMLVNLVQIASGGQKVTQEIREMATRMPYLVGIIIKEFGGIGKELNKIDPQEFVNRLAKATESLDVNFASSSLAVENLQDAFDRLYIAIGTILESNPELIALIITLTQETDKYTNSLMKNDSQTRKSAESITSKLSKAILETIIIVMKLASAMVEAGQIIAASIQGWVGVFKLAKIGFEGFVNFFISGINHMVDGLNLVISLAKQIPFGVGGQGVDALASLGEIGKIQGFNVEADMDDFKTGFLRQSKFIWEDIGKDWKKTAAEADRLRTAFAANREEIIKQQKRAQESTYVATDQDRAKAVGRDDGKKGAALSNAGLTAFATDRTKAEFNKAMRRLSPELRAKIADAAVQYDIPTALAFAQIFSESTFNTKAKSPYNPGVGPAFGLTQVLPSTATRVLGRKTSGEQLFNENTALEAWGKYMTQLFNEFGDWEMAAFAYHNGEGAARQFNRALEQGRAKQYAKKAPKGVAYARKISALAGLSDTEQFGLTDTKEFSDQQTKKLRDDRIRALIDVYKKIGLVPSPEMINDFQRVLTDEARKGLDVGFGRGIQPTDKEVSEFFRNNRNNKLGPVDAPAAQITEQITRRKNLQEQYIDGLRVELGLTTDNADQQDRYTKYILRTMTVEEELNTYLEDRSLTIKETVLDLDREYQLMLRRNTQDERGLLALQERNDIMREIIDLEDRTATLGVNAALRYQRAWADATFEVQNAIVEANESTIRANVELDDANKYHGDIVRARVLEHIRDTKSLSEGTAEAIIDLYDSATNAISDMLDKIGIGKVAGLGSFLKSSAGNLVRNLTRSLVDKIPGLSDLSGVTERPELTEAKAHTKLLQQVVINTGRLAGPGTPQVSGVPGLPSVRFPSIPSLGIGGGFGGGSGLSIPGGGIPGAATGTFTGQPINLPFFGNNPFAGPSAGALGGAIGSNIPSVLDTSTRARVVPGHPITQAGGGILAQLKGLVGKGGIFGDKGFGFNSGTISGIGGIAGIAGGLIGGNIGSVLTGVASGIGAAASLASILSISSIGGPIGLAIGGAIGGLMAIGSILFGNQKQRKADEKTRDKGMVDSLAALNKILRAVQSDKMDGESAISNAEQIRSDYVDAMSQLKDKKTRNIALKDVSRLDAVIMQIKSAAGNQASRKARLDLYVPTFADGGSLSKFGARHMGTVLGYGGPKDDMVPALLSPREYVLDAATTANVGANNLDWLRRNKGAGVGHMFRQMRRMTPFRMADGGMALGSPDGLGSSPVSGPSGGEPKVHVQNYIYQTETGYEIRTETFLDTPQGQKKLEATVEKVIYRNGAAGPIPTALREVRKG